MKRTFQMDPLKPFRGALDFSGLLDAPAGKHGFLKRNGEALVFEDGTIARFWGTNVVGPACAPTHEVAEIVSKRMASAGINILRFHYMDGELDLGEGGTAGTLIEGGRADTRHLSKDALERLDYFIYCLNQEGIYVRLDLFVGRNFIPEGDELDYSEVFPKSWAVKQYDIFNKRLRDLQKEYNQQLLTHVNRYKGIRYADDPGIAILQIHNENSLLWDMGIRKGGWSKLTSPYFMELYRRWMKWLKARYGTQEALEAAWTNDKGVCALQSTEHLNVHIAFPTEAYFTSGEHGVPSDTPYDSVNSPVRTSEFIRFLMEVETDYSKDMYRYLRDELGVKCCISTTNMVQGAGSAFATSRDSDLAEHDAYYNHPRFGFSPPAVCTTIQMYSQDPRDTKQGIVMGNLISQLATAPVAGKPFFVPEWNDVFPTEFASDAMYMMAAYGAFQDWRGICGFAYGGAETKKQLEKDYLDFYFFQSINPAMFGQNGVCAKIFLDRLIQPAQKSVIVAYSPQDTVSNNPKTFYKRYLSLPYLTKVRNEFYEEQSGDTARDLTITGGFTASGKLKEPEKAMVFSESAYEDSSQKVRNREKYLEEYRKAGAYVIEGSDSLFQEKHRFDAEVNRALKAKGVLGEKQGITQDNTFVSDTDELQFDLTNHTFEAHGEKVFVFSGDADKEIQYGRFTLRIANERMSVSLIALDDRPLETSGHMLLTAVGDCGNTGMRREGDWLLDLGHGPVWIDQVEGSFSCPSDHKTEVYALSPVGDRAELLARREENGRQLFDFTSREAAIHYEIVRT